jgi:sulfite reductase (NADPH) hemoprotein beta-component
MTIRQSPHETFLETFRRTGMDPFKAALYPDEGAQDAA